MKIIYIAPFVKSRYKGGITQIAEYLSEFNSIQYMKNNDISVEFFNSYIIDQEINTDGKFNLRNIIQAFLFLIKLSFRVIKNDFDLLHFNSSKKIPLFKDQLIISITRLFTRKKIILQIHSCGINETFLKVPLLRRFQISMLKKCNKIILLSKVFEQEIINLGLPAEKICVLYNFHNVRITKYNNESHGDLRLLFIGSISKIKGFQDLILALTKIDFNYTLNVLGLYSSNNMKSDIDNIICEHKLNVRFHGYLSGEAKNSILLNSDILILPSYAEGFPMVIPEAMAFGCAIISTKIADIPEIIKENINGCLVKPGQIDQLVEKLNYLNYNRGILNTIKRQNHITSLTYSLENYISKLSAIYKN